MSLDSGPSNWSLSTAQQCDGYGIFDFALKVLEDHKNDEVFGGETGTFTFTVSGSGFSESDFYTEFSAPVGGEPVVMILGAKFQRGPIGSGSGYSATDVPEPATVCLLGLGMLALLRKRRA